MAINLWPTQWTSKLFLLLAIKLSAYVTTSIEYKKPHLKMEWKSDNRSSSHHQPPTEQFK